MRSVNNGFRVSVCIKERSSFRVYVFQCMDDAGDNNGTVLSVLLKTNDGSIS